MALTLLAYVINYDIYFVSGTVSTAYGTVEGAWVYSFLFRYLFFYSPPSPKTIGYSG